MNCKDTAKIIAAGIEVAANIALNNPTQIQSLESQAATQQSNQAQEQIVQANDASFRRSDETSIQRPR